MKAKLYILLFILLSFTFNIANAQTITLIPNPDTIGSVGDDDSGFYPIVFNNSLFFEYRNSYGDGTKVQLAKYDGTNVTLIANPNNGFGACMYNANAIIFNNSLYFEYSNSSSTSGNPAQLAKYDGINLTLIPNPDTSQGGALGWLIVYNNELYFSYENSSCKFQLAKYNGINITLINNPDNGEVSDNPVIFNNNLYFQYHNSSGIFQLAKYDGTNVTLITNPDNGNGVEFWNYIFNNNLYFPYQNSSAISQLAKYDGTNVTLIPNPDNTGNVSGWDTPTPIIFNNVLYFGYYNNTYWDGYNWHYKYQLAKYTGANISLISNPDTAYGIGGYPIIFNNSLYYDYLNTSNKYQLAKCNGINITLISNPNTTGEVGGYDSGQIPIIFNNDLYFQYTYNYSSSSVKLNLAKFDGTNITLITNPDTGIGTTCGWQGNVPFELIVFNNTLYFPYKNSSYYDHLAKFDGTNSINEIVTNNDIKIYPNPTINELSIESPQSAVIGIINIQGQLIKTITAIGTKTNIDVSDLPSGLYIVKVQTTKGMSVSKFIKE